MSGARLRGPWTPLAAGHGFIVIVMMIIIRIIINMTIKREMGYAGARSTVLESGELVCRCPR